jgi:hypothetical protein
MLCPIAYCLEEILQKDDTHAGCWKVTRFGS